MEKNKLIEDGNFPRWFRLCLLAIGRAIFYCTIKFVPPSLWSGLLLMLRFAIALVGGMTSRAAMYKITAFENSFKKAHDSYKS